MLSKTETSYPSNQATQLLPRHHLLDPCSPTLFLESTLLISCFKSPPFNSVSPTSPSQQITPPHQKKTDTPRREEVEHVPSYLYTASAFFLPFRYDRGSHSSVLAPGRWTAPQLPAQGETSSSYYVQSLRFSTESPPKSHGSWVFISPLHPESHADPDKAQCSEHSWSGGPTSGSCRDWFQTHGGGDTQRKGGSDVTTEAEIDMMQPQGENAWSCPQ
eukprot:XP_016864376.1 uncharacterized protein LOC105377622 [Homo sapiens]